MPAPDRSLVDRLRAHACVTDEEADALERMERERDALTRKAALADELAEWIRSDSVELFPRADWLARYDAKEPQ